MSGASVIGMCQHTGRLLSGLDHLRQSISRILFTVIGTRTQRYTFGAYLFEYVSAAGNQATRLKLIANIAKAIITWEPRIKLSHITIGIQINGKSIIEIFGSYDSQSFSHAVNVQVAA